MIYPPLMANQGQAAGGMERTVTVALEWIAGLAAGGAVAWATAVAGLAVLQRRFLYRPPRVPSGPPPAGWSEARAGDALRGWWCPPPEDDAPVLVVFHGNKGTLARIAAKAAPWREAGCGLFAATYRGYEGNPGRPDEAGLYADADAALDWLAGHGVAAGRIVLYGESLGSGAAVQMAATHPVAALVLEAPFTGIAALGAARYPWAPARLLTRDRYDNRAKIGALDLPILILHGTRDATTPFAHAQALAAAATRVQLVAIDGAGHTDLFEHGADRPLLAFLAAARPSPAGCQAARGD